LGGALGFHHAHKAQRIAGEHRPEPAQLAKAGRRAPHRDRLAALSRLARLKLSVRDDHLHPDGSDVPTRSGETTEQRIATFLFGKMEALRIELPREAFDVFGGEGERAKLAPPPDLGVFE